MGGGQSFTRLTVGETDKRGFAPNCSHRYPTVFGHIDLQPEKHQTSQPPLPGLSPHVNPGSVVRFGVAQ